MRVAITKGLPKEMLNKGPYLFIFGCFTGHERKSGAAILSGNLRERMQQNGWSAVVG
jgi:hypothetical protein